MIYHVNIIIFQKVYFTIKRLNRYQFIIISLRTLKFTDVISASKTFTAVRVKFYVDLIDKLLFYYQVFREIIILLSKLL